MNYLALGLAVFTGILAVYSLSHFARVMTGKKKWTDEVWGPILQAAWAALTSTLSFALFMTAVGA